MQECALCNKPYIASVSLHSTARLLNSVCWVHLFFRRKTRARFLSNATFFSNLSTAVYKVDHELCWARNSLHLNNSNVHYYAHKTPTFNHNLGLFNASTLIPLVTLALWSHLHLRLPWVLFRWSFSANLVTISRFLRAWCMSATGVLIVLNQ